MWFLVMPLDLRQKLLAAFDYDVRTGKLTNKQSRGRAKKGSEAGSVSAGYRRIKFEGRLYLGHVLIWIMKFGAVPDGLEIDHVNGIRFDNRLENMRLVSRAVNAKNKKRYRNNASGYSGVVFNKSVAKWEARIDSSKKREYLGVFDNFDDALSARLLAEKRHDYHENHGRLT